MSHRAVVGVPASENTVDLHVSTNGANNLKIYPIYEQLLAAGQPSQVLSLDEPLDDVSADVEALRESFDADPSTNQAVDREPFRQNISPMSIGSELDFVLYEAVFLPTRYLTGDESRGPISAFIPVLVDISILLVFAKCVKLEVYSRDSLPTDPQRALESIRDGNETPDHSVSGVEYLSIDEDPELYEYFIDNHVGLLQTLFATLGDQGTGYVSSVMTEDAYLVCRGDNSSELRLPEPIGRGLLIRLPLEDFTHEQVVSLYRDWRYLANRLRIEHSLAIARDLLSGSMEESAEEIDIGAKEMALVEDLYDEFGDEVSALTPEPYSV